MVLRAHGGLDRWRTFEQVSATIVSGGGLLPMKGIKIDLEPLEGLATIHHESTVIRPFGRPDWRMVFTPERVVIEMCCALQHERRNVTPKARKNAAPTDRTNEGIGPQVPSTRAEAEGLLSEDSTRIEEIRHRAYELYLERGQEPGRELDDWLQAEREINGLVPVLEVAKKLLPDESAQK
jgi:hypothetical protein